MRWPLKDSRIKGVHEEQRLRALKRFVGLLDFGCQRDGAICVHLPSCWCCIGLGDGARHIKYVAEEDESIYLASYRPGGPADCGFWDQDSGCRLPWELRPVACLMFICPEAVENLDLDYHAGLKALLEVMRELEEVVERTEIGDQQWLSR